MTYNLEEERRWARKRRLRKERKQKFNQKKVESYRKTARLRLQEMYKAGFESKRSVIK